ncbi:MAG: AraC family transcriptional regulator [Nostoc sp.]|uniref:AraC family transcriptional regulator n=1 Tax=Nostoc sp. TaxID=1180 RepID=UPI002FF00342
MTITLSSSDYDELWEQSWHNTHRLYQSDNFDDIFDYPKELGTGYRRLIWLQDGFWLRVREFECREFIRCDDYEEGWTASVLTFFICGDAGVVIHKTNDYFHEISGQNSLEFGSAMETEEWPANQRIFRVQICMEPSFLKSYGSDQLDSIPLQLKNLIEGNKQEDFNLLGTTTPAMQLAIGQILTCPYRGWMKQRYLESKALELLVLHLEQTVKREQGLNLGTTLKSTDIDRIYDAKEILLRHFDNPPSLLDLAKQAGINHNKLKRGFREIFGTTVFGYLHDYRMEKARQLLCEGKLSVATVANIVGYANTGHFAVAFKRKFSISPSACRLGEKPTI